MGYDVYGLNPAMREIDENKYKTYNKYKDMEYVERQKLFDGEQDLQRTYYDECWAREAENPGVYFRNNVWWWRPLWNYVCCECDDFLDGEDMRGGDSNDGHVITEDKACAIAKRLFQLIDDGEVKGYEDFHKQRASEANADNERLLEDGGEKYGKGWNWAESYPFNVENVREFATFCSESGGFEIC
tara:strand:+ start:1241 stop:1798 length:558 start_codon:yes stop_codon:yes gene_type:complete